MKTPEKLDGKRFGSMMAVAPCGSDNGVVFMCLCDCGENMQILWNADNIRKGNRWWPDMPEAAQ